MPRRSAGLLLFRRTPAAVEVLLAHPGGPLWEKRDAGAWTVPKGEIEADEEPFAVARREFEEETGHPPPGGEPIPLGEIRQKGGKLVVAWALEGDLDSRGVYTMDEVLGSAAVYGLWLDAAKCKRPDCLHVSPPVCADAASALPVGPPDPPRPCTR